MIRFFLYCLMTVWVSSSLANKLPEVVVPIVSELRTDLAQACIVKEVEASNLEVIDHKVLIDKAEAWRAEYHQKFSGPLIELIDQNDLSAFVKKVQEESEGLYLGILIMNAQGVAVGESITFPHYLHDTLPAWKETFKVGKDAIYVSKVFPDSTTQQIVLDLGLPIMDSKDQVIGAALIRLNAKLLGVST